MALSIKNAETEALARDLATRTDNSVTGAITDALRHQLELLDATDDDAAFARLERLRAISADAANRWPRTDAGDATAWLYDERGLPA